ncbi:MAG: flagellin [Myxococcota bacterium]|nr:flagellin [Myxococcota bacterium]
MGLYVNTNIASLNAKRNVNGANRSLGRSFERLSSGLRINSAKDDAAGLGISDRMTAQVRGINQAIRNTNDGISLAQTAEGGLAESTSLLQRIRELSVQSANDTNTETDRTSLQQEVDALVTELDRIAEKTTFNNQTVLDGSFIGAKFHIGANADDTITVSIKDARASSLGRQVRESSTTDITVAAAADALQQNDIVFNGVTIRATNAADDALSTTLNAASALAKAAAINDATEFSGVRAIVDDTIVVGTADIGAVTLDSTTNLTINGAMITGFRVEANDATDTLVNAINAATDDTGVVASLNQDNRLELTAEDGRNIEVTMAGAAIGGLGGGAGTFVTGGRITLQSEEQFSLTGNVGGATKLGFAAAQQLFGVNANNAVGTIDVTTREGANRAIDIADVAIKQVSGIRAELGATQNRLESTVNNLSVAAENVTAARSRIRDADFAVETADFSRNQIIQQAGISVLAQANQQPQIALALLA